MILSLVDSLQLFFRAAGRAPSTAGADARRYRTRLHPLVRQGEDSDCPVTAEFYSAAAMTIKDNEFVDLQIPTDLMRPLSRTGNDALCAVNANFTWHEFNGQYAFIRDEGHRYDPALAMQCSQMALELFHRKLGEGDLPAKAASGPAETKH
jgi:hypothetical protein